MLDMATNMFNVVIPSAGVPSVGNSLIEGQVKGIGSVIPETVETVEGTLIPMEEVNDQVTVIQNDPAPLPATFAAAENLSLFRHHFIHGIGQGRDLIGVAAGSNNHIVAKDREMGDIEHNDVPGFPVVEQLSQTEREFLILHLSSSFNQSGEF